MIFLIHISYQFFLLLVYNIKNKAKIILILLNNKIYSFKIIAESHCITNISKST